MFDAEGRQEDEPCPACGSLETISYYYREGFVELECPRCGYRSDAEELSDLQRFSGDLLEKEGDSPPVPLRTLKA